MTEMIIETGIVIDDIEGVVEGVRQLSGKYISSGETIKKFITNEKATKFYIDNKCSCRMQPEHDTVYLWLDSGFTDYYGNPIMISLLKTYDGYCGHFYGTMKDLAAAIRGFFPKNVKDINRNLSTLKDKYLNKIADRTHLHIDDEQTYLMDLVNEDAKDNLMYNLLKGFELTAVDLPETIIEEVTEEPDEAPSFEMSFKEKEITVGLLLETIDGMQDYINELLAEIEKFNSEDRTRMQELEAKNAELQEALVKIRMFNSEEEADEESASGMGHTLLGKKKILVLGGTVLDMNVMNGISKLFGFEKKDFEYEVDYEKVVSVAERVQNSNRYAAIIFGACPHKVAGLGEWSSLIEKCKKSPDMPFGADARSNSGKLKVSKESYKKALISIIEELSGERLEVR